MADLALVNGSIWTLNSSQPWAEAVAVRGEKIMRVGSTAEIRKMAGVKTEVVDLKGAFVLPGFIDSHTHFLDWRFFAGKRSAPGRDQPRAVCQEGGREGERNGEG